MTEKKIYTLIIDNSLTWRITLNLLNEQSYVLHLLSTFRYEQNFFCLKFERRTNIEMNKNLFFVKNISHEDNRHTHRYFCFSLKLKQLNVYTELTKQKKMSIYCSISLFSDGIISKHNRIFYAIKFEDIFTFNFIGLFLFNRFFCLFDFLSFDFNWFLCFIFRFSCL